MIERASSVSDFSIPRSFTPRLRGFEALSTKASIQQLESLRSTFIADEDRGKDKSNGVKGRHQSSTARLPPSASSGSQGHHLGSHSQTSTPSLTPSSVSSCSSSTPQTELATPPISSSMATVPLGHDYPNKRLSPETSVVRQELHGRNSGIKVMRDRLWHPVDDVVMRHDDREASKPFDKRGPPESQYEPTGLASSSRHGDRERLPGIASLDEQMGTPWSAGLAAYRREEGGTGSGSRSPFGSSALYFGDRISSSLSHDQDRSFGTGISERRGSGREGISPRMGTLKRSFSPAADGSSDPLRANVPFHRNDQDTRRGERYPASPFGAMSVHSFRKEDDVGEYRRWRSQGHDALSSALRPLPGNRTYHQSSPTTSRDPNSRVRSRENWRVASVGDASEYGQDIYHSGMPAATARSSVSGDHVIPHADAQQVRIYDSSDDPSGAYEEGRKTSPRHHPYRMQQGCRSPSLAEAQPSADAAAAGSPSASRRRGKLPKPVTDLLKTWLLEHASHPYPTEDEKKQLCDATGLSISQVSNWFINARRRILVPTGSGNFGVHPGAGGAVDGPRHKSPPDFPPAPGQMGSRYEPGHFAQAPSHALAAQRFYDVDAPPSLPPPQSRDQYHAQRYQRSASDVMPPTHYSHEYRSYEPGTLQPQHPDAPYYRRGLPHYQRNSPSPPPHTH